MKIVFRISLLLVLLAITGCEKHDLNDPDVEAFIEQLVTGNYEAYELPAFTEKHIPALLKYRNETTNITKFPRNGISSLYQPNCKLGLYVLWTIESIRAVEIKSDYLIGRFPSQNPILALKDATELQLIYDAISHSIAAEAYNNWWNSSFPFSEKMKADPLENTNYKWH